MAYVPSHHCAEESKVPKDNLTSQNYAENYNHVSGKLRIHHTK